VGVELRKGRLYWYERRRVNGRVRVDYFGPVSAAEAKLIRRKAVVAAGLRECARDDAEAARANADAVLATGAEFDRLADRVFRTAMHLAGYRLHRRSEWRRKRGVRPMTNLDELLAANRPNGPAPAIIKPVSTVPAHQTILDRAAAGDRSVLPAVQKLLAETDYAHGWGALAGMARAGLIRMVAGDDLMVAEAVRLKMDDYVRELLADGGPAPAYAEKLAATRAAHNWVVVHVLECKAAVLDPGSPAAVVLDRRVTQAERRLHAALKSLAVLRRLRRPGVVKQVNVAHGPMLVDNRGTAAGGVG